MDATHPKSILELLTHPNPATIHRNLQSGGNTSHQDWYIPKRIIKWTDFQDLQILKQSFNGRLYEEACREREGFRCFPEIFDEEKIILSETEVRDLIVRWVKANALAGHKPIAEEFHPLLWAKGDRPDAKNAMPPLSPPKPKRVMQERRVSMEAKRRRTGHGRVGIPDSVGSTDFKGPSAINREISRGSNGIARQEVEEREEGEVDENGDGVGVVSGSNDSEGTISGSETSKGTGAGSEDLDTTELDPTVSGTKLKSSQRRTKKRKHKR
ncbi:unnamed protein product [Clonostachys solani]|uniref:Uncharacterized protein n=1 Tax=Clonostachys solani TaxID=160281 RepID=A0A9P0EPM7_9HYPO|nr:unnamed protein product [Clonostachys solani]